ncbi:hypothetical protein CPB83DRAFT_859133 [Crepidotus variabilis]|uniref:Uncharacterized protein n=1 Tax=Crepidotus variabilis TaxID=179855 RepID=A0A9P6JM01_9AGAR|nr:hypothetical protein CPB83DRAFT_859133 [Crepidotus variabilis]
MSKWSFHRVFAVSRKVVNVLNVMLSIRVIILSAIMIHKTSTEIPGVYLIPPAFGVGVGGLTIISILLILFLSGRRGCFHHDFTIRQELICAATLSTLWISTCTFHTIVFDQTVYPSRHLIHLTNLDNVLVELCNFSRLVATLSVAVFLFLLFQCMFLLVLALELKKAGHIDVSVDQVQDLDKLKENRHGYEPLSLRI